jgi:hypothetical protein
MLSVKTIKFVGAVQSNLSKKWLLKFELYRDGSLGGMMRTAPQYSSEEDAIIAGKDIEEKYNITGIFPNLFKMF